MNPVAIVAHLLVAVGITWRLAQAAEFITRGGRS